MCACVIGLLYTCASLVCHKIMTEQMPSSSPRGLVQVLSMVLLSALSSEYFLTWLLNMLWAGTWHRAALAPKVLVLFQTKCHCAWPHSASEEGEAKHLGGGTLHPGYDTAPQISSPSERSKRWAGRDSRKAGDCWFLRGRWLGCRVPHALPSASRSAVCLTLCRVQAEKLPLLEGPAQPLVPVLLPARTCEGSPGKGEPACVSHHLNLGPVQLQHALFISCRCSQLLTDCRGCWGSSALASTP